MVELWLHIYNRKMRYFRDTTIDYNKTIKTFYVRVRMNFSLHLLDYFEPNNTYKVYAANKYGVIYCVFTRTELTIDSIENTRKEAYSIMRSAVALAKAKYHLEQSNNLMANK